MERGWGSDAPDEAAAFELYTLAAEQGHTMAAYNVGNMLDDGIGTLQDATRAVMWYTRAAADGDEMALFALGEMRHSGRGCPIDEAEAARCYAGAVSGGGGVPCVASESHPSTPRLSAGTPSRSSVWESCTSMVSGWCGTSRRV